MKITALAALPLLAVFPLGAVYAAPQQPKTATSPLVVKYHTIKRNKAKYYEVSVKYPVFAGTSPVVRQANNALSAYANKEVDDFLKQTEADIAEQKSNGFEGIYTLEITPSVSLARPDLISLTFGRSIYLGGAHPGFEYHTMAFGMVGGKTKTLELRDLFRAGFNPYGGLDRYIIPQLRKQKASLITDGEKKTLNKGDMDGWYLTTTGIKFQFSPYVVASYAEGTFDAQCSFAELKKVLNPQGPLRPLL